MFLSYSPCIAHGLKGGMGKSQEEEKRAIECGYWHLWRYDPRLETEGKIAIKRVQSNLFELPSVSNLGAAKNPFTLGSKEPDWTKFQDFLKSEIRFSSLQKQFPEVAEELFQATEENAKWRYNGYKRLAQ